MYYDDDKMRCNSCGSDHLEKLDNKSAFTSLSQFQVYRCGGCGKIMRDRSNQLTKEKRENLVMNVR
jgi:DNA-directed RNA polymerase subunit RPC12/RpoP